MDENKARKPGYGAELHHGRHGLQIKYAGCKRTEVRKQMAASVEERLEKYTSVGYVSEPRGDDLRQDRSLSLYLMHGVFQ